MRNRIAILLILTISAGLLYAEGPALEAEPPHGDEPKGDAPGDAEPGEGQPSEHEKRVQKTEGRVNPDGTVEVAEKKEDPRLAALKEVRPLTDWTEYSRDDRVKEFGHLYTKWWQKFRGEYFEEAELIQKNEVGRYVERDLEFLKELTRSEEAAERQLAFDLLSLVVEESSQDVIDFLIGVMDDPPQQENGRMAARAAARAARIAQSPEVMRDALARFEDDEADQRELAILAMSELQDPAAIEPLLDRLETGEAKLRERIWIYFAFAGIGAPTPQLRDYLEHRLAESEAMLEKIALEDTLFRLGQQPDLRRIASSMERLEHALRGKDIGPGTREGGRIVSKSLQDLIDDIIDEASRQPQPPPGEGQGEADGPPEEGKGSDASDAQGEGAQSQQPGSYDAAGMDEQGAEAILEKYLHRRVDEWGNLPPDAKNLLLDMLKNPNMPPKYRTLLDSYFEAIARQEREGR